MFAPKLSVHKTGSSSESSMPRISTLTTMTTVLLMAGAFIPWTDASAYTLKTLYGFGSNPRAGAIPIGGLLLDQSGNLYGTTDIGGGKGGAAGTVWELIGGKRLKVLHTFPHDGSQGTRAQGFLIVDTAGNVYGTTVQGGAHNGGNAFELSPNGDGSWTFQVLYNFCSQANCADGAAPSGLTYEGASSGVPYDGVSPLFGTAGKVAFQLVLGEQGWTESVLYTFCSQGAENCTDGSEPMGGVFVDGSGSLFGTTFSGGANGRGTVFELTQ